MWSPAPLTQGGNPERKLGTQAASGIDSTLPAPLADILRQAMKDVWYPDGKHPLILDRSDGRPAPDLISEAYDLSFRYLKLVTVDGFSHEPPDPPDLFPNLDFPTMSDPAAMLPRETEAAMEGEVSGMICSILFSR